MTAARVWRTASRYVISTSSSRTFSGPRIVTTCKAQYRSKHLPANPQPRYLVVHQHDYSTKSTQVKSADPSSTSRSKSLNEGAIDRLHKEFTLDEDINSRWVQLKNQESGKLKDAQTLISILSTIDRDKETVRQLGAPPDAPIIVEITTWEALRGRIQAKEASQAAAAKSVRDSKPKQIELNWAISGHDLDMKMKQMREFVEKGKKVEILLAAKKRQRRATPEEAQNVIQHIRQTISEIEKCKEIKPMDGAIGGQALMTIQKLKS